MTTIAAVNINKIFGVKDTDYIYEDDQCVVFKELRDPQAPVHFLVVPRRVLPRVSQATDQDEQLLGHLLLVAHKMAAEKGLNKSGYHIMVDEDWRAMRVKSLHVFGRSLLHMLWPVGPGAKL